MAYTIDPYILPDLSLVIKPGGVWYDVQGRGDIVSPQLGTKVTGPDAREYILVVAGGSIAANAQVGIDTDFEATTGGTSGYYTQDTAVVEGDYFWARKSAL